MRLSRISTDDGGKWLLGAELPSASIKPLPVLGNINSGTGRPVR